MWFPSGSLSVFLPWWKMVSVTEVTSSNRALMGGKWSVSLANIWTICKQTSERHENENSWSEERFINRHWHTWRVKSRADAWGIVLYIWPNISLNWETIGAKSCSRVFTDFSKMAHTAWQTEREVNLAVTVDVMWQHVTWFLPPPPVNHSAIYWEQSGSTQRPAGAPPPPERHTNTGQHLQTSASGWQRRGEMGGAYRIGSSRRRGWFNGRGALSWLLLLFADVQCGEEIGQQTQDVNNGQFIRGVRLKSQSRIRVTKWNVCAQASV